MTAGIVCCCLPVLPQLYRKQLAPSFRKHVTPSFTSLRSRLLPHTEPKTSVVKDSFCSSDATETATIGSESTLCQSITCPMPAQTYHSDNFKKAQITSLQSNTRNGVSAGIDELSPPTARQPAGEEEEEEEAQRLHAWGQLTRGSKATVAAAAAVAQERGRRGQGHGHGHGPRGDMEMGQIWRDRCFSVESESGPSCHT